MTRSSPAPASPAMETSSTKAPRQRPEPRHDWRLATGRWRPEPTLLVTNLSILVLAGWLGFVGVSKGPNTLHTPLMPGTNAIHGIVILGGLLVLGLSGNGIVNKVL